MADAEAAEELEVASAPLSQAEQEEVCQLQLSDAEEGSTAAAIPAGWTRAGPLRTRAQIKPRHRNRALQWGWI